MNVYQKYVRRHHKCTAHQNVYFKKWLICDIIMTFAVADVTLARAAPVYMVYPMFCRIFVFCYFVV